MSERIAINVDDTPLGSLLRKEGQVELPETQRNSVTSQAWVDPLSSHMTSNAPVAPVPMPTLATPAPQAGDTGNQPPLALDPSQLPQAPVPQLNATPGAEMQPAAFQPPLTEIPQGVPALQVPMLQPPVLDLTRDNLVRIDNGSIVKVGEALAYQDAMNRTQNRLLEKERRVEAQLQILDVASRSVVIATAVQALRASEAMGRPISEKDAIDAGMRAAGYYAASDATGTAGGALNGQPPIAGQLNGQSAQPVRPAVPFPTDENAPDYPQRFAEYQAQLTGDRVREAMQPFIANFEEQRNRESQKQQMQMEQERQKAMIVQHNNQLVDTYLTPYLPANYAALPQAEKDVIRGHLSKIEQEEGIPIISSRFAETRLSDSDLKVVSQRYQEIVRSMPPTPPPAPTPPTMDVQQQQLMAQQQAANAAAQQAAQQAGFQQAALSQGTQGGPYAPTGYYQPAPNGMMPTGVLPGVLPTPMIQPPQQVFPGFHPNGMLGQPPVSSPLQQTAATLTPQAQGQYPQLYQQPGFVQAPQGGYAPTGYAPGYPQTGNPQGFVPGGYAPNGYPQLAIPRPPVPQPLQGMPAISTAMPAPRPSGSSDQRPFDSYKLDFLGLSEHASQR